ncbi:sulfatase [Jiangella aurantiaca]|nr:sulfatase-like hydrolase/transferase [Jiangella aurantiaca]
MTEVRRSRPNVLVILTDQQFAGAMSCAGNPDLSTPAMDALASAGVRFQNAYCAQPLCSPSRASMMTGLMPHQTGVTGNAAAMDDTLRKRQLGYLFADAGYDCAYGGKWHLPDYDMVGDYGFGRVFGFGDDHLADDCVAFIREARDRPFFLVAAFDNPHNICEWARNEPLPWGDVPDAATDECPTLPANFPIAPYEPELIRIAQAQFPRWYPVAGWSDDHWRHYRHTYYRLCEKVDAEIGRLLDAVRTAGLEEDTLILFSSDHGDGMGAHRWNQKWTLYEESVRVPFIVSWKGVTTPGAVSGDLVSAGADVLPTLCDLAGIDAPDGLAGASLRDVCEGRGSGARPDQVVVETRWDSPVLPHAYGRMLRTRRYKYAVYAWGRNREQLFDLETDPGEMVNLAQDARHGMVLDEHRSRLAGWCDRTGDDFLRVRLRG